MKLPSKESEKKKKTGKGRKNINKTFGQNVANV
jgi:hypothetical protein